MIPFRHDLQDSQDRSESCKSCKSCQIIHRCVYKIQRLGQDIPFRS
jgi:hypothetical protein